MKIDKIDQLVNKILSIPKEEYNLRFAFIHKGEELSWNLIGNCVLRVRTLSNPNSRLDYNWDIEVVISQDQFRRLRELYYEIQEYVENLRADFIINE